MCNCSNNNLIIKQSLSLRSSDIILTTHQEVINFSRSSDYNSLVRNFGNLVKFDSVRLITYNHTIKQALFIPLKHSLKEKSVLFSFFDLNKNDFFSVIIESVGDFSNFLNMSGKVKMYTSSRKLLFEGIFSNNEFTSIIPVNPPAPGLANFMGCLDRSAQQIGSSGLGTITCLLFPEECAGAIVGHCLIDSIF